MIRKLFYLFVWFYGMTAPCPAQQNAPRPFGPVPSENQMRWQEMEYYAFLHFSINTFTDQEWGSGGDDVRIFNPDSLDCRQWARVCKGAGMKGIILTVKHHSGFCLWPSKYTEYSVKNTAWKNGKGDIVRELADACKEYGLKLGIYLSPWDRNYAGYGRPEYITYFRNQLRELLTHYGDIFEIWFDGANGGSGYYGGANETRKIDPKTYYDWKNTYQLIRSLQPKIVIWNDGGDRGDLRWVGTEAGNVGETNWSLLNDTGEVTWPMLHYGLENGNAWVPGEVNTSIRPGWFYHTYEDSKVKNLPQLMDLYYNSSGRNATLLLNFPIDRHGLIHPNDSLAALQLARAVKDAFSVNLAAGARATASNVRGNAKAFAPDKATDGQKDSYWATDDGVTQASITLDFGKPTTFNRVMAQEYIRLGQRVRTFRVEALTDGQWKELAMATTIGYKRMLLFPTVTATQLRLTITDAKACPLISNLAVYYAPLILTPPLISRNRSGEINILEEGGGSDIYYTLDGTPPTGRSPKYSGPFPTDGRVLVQAVAFDPSSGKSSAVSREEFDISHSKWKIIGTDDQHAGNTIDGNPNSAWHQGAEKKTPTGEKKMPIDLELDLGEMVNLSGFRYLPDQDWRHTGLIAVYQLFVSSDGRRWQMADDGEFPNINNNPLWQIRKFSPVQARYIKLRALRNTRGNDDAGYAELDVITE
ncbi:MAG: discoidin domain-containing protein [Bacteroidota bacterium]|nr:discoidin domain-containing protein [Bacteroidota bacterium]MDP4246134.1 discoidin domain-containing protein [Bacteroidota bacterium]MDP4252823.1 discoidin domain-containing protein [Bacteroidota bacterium]MDP4257218.1 discoidin domain-containing protein [Bacteroidota bacterium]